jgi:hypothetical protein
VASTSLGGLNATALKAKARAKPRQGTQAPERHPLPSLIYCLFSDGRKLGCDTSGAALGQLPTRRILAPVAAKRANPRPPKFLHGEDVRVVRVTGSETSDTSGELVNVEGLVGATLNVNDARPTRGRDGWLIAVTTYDASEDVEDDVWFAEDSLKRVGLNPTRQERRESIWRDNVDLRLVTKVIYDDPGKDEQGDTPVTDEDEEVERIAESAEAALRELVESRQLLWGCSVAHGDPMEIKLLVEPTGDLLAAYQRIVAAPPSAWLHGEGSQGFPVSSWERRDGEDTHFLAPGIVSATVTCEHWSTPERLIALSTPRRKRVRLSPP